MFSFPGLLWFLPIIGLVVLIHFINLLRYRRIEWAAMEFLLASYKKSRTRLLFQQLILMFLRTLAVTVIILMFASPQLDGRFAQWFGNQSVHHIILLDDSYSLNERNLAQGGVPIFDDAAAIIRQIAETGHNDRLTLLKLSSFGMQGTSSPPELLLNELRLDADGKQTVHNVLSNLQPSSTAHEPAMMFSVAEDIVRQTVGFNPVVYFLSDFRRRNWEDSASILTSAETIRQHGGAVRMIRIAQAEQPNLGIGQLRLVEGIHAADVDILLDATIVNYSSTVAENVLAALFINGEMRSQQIIPLIPAGGKTVPAVRFPVRVSSSETHCIEVRLQPDALPDDNNRYFTLQVPDALEILLITPSSSDTSSPFVRVALSPGGVRSGLAVRQELPGFLAEHPLDSFSAIFLLDMPTLEFSAIRALENYVADGGGVAFFPGTNTDIEFVRNYLYKAGTGLFPAAPMMIHELLPDYLTSSPDIQVRPHPIFRLFTDTESPWLRSVVIDRYLAIEPSVDPSVNILATLRNDAPLVLSKTFGQGRTITFLTTASPDWNNWVRNPSYVIILLELAAWLSQRHDNQSFLVGDSLGNDLLAYQPGFHTVQSISPSGQELSEIKAVNVNPLEGDIRQLDITEISDILKTARLSMETPASFSMSGNDHSPVLSAGDWLLFAVILLLLGEIFLAGRILPPRKTNRTLRRSALGRGR